MPISATHVLIVLIIVLLLFGAPKLPGMARNIGKSMKIFKSEVRDLRDEDSPRAEITEDGGPSAEDQLGTDAKRQGDSAKRES